MKKRFHLDDLTYGVLLAALVSFIFATVLDGVRVNDLAGVQAAAATTLVAAQVAPAVATAPSQAPAVAR